MSDLIACRRLPFCSATVPRSVTPQRLIAVGCFSSAFTRRRRGSLQFVRREASLWLVAGRC